MANTQIFISSILINLSLSKNCLPICNRPKVLLFNALGFFIKKKKL